MNGDAASEGVTQRPDGKEARGEQETGQQAEVTGKPEAESIAAANARVEQASSGAAQGAGQNAGQGAEQGAVRAEGGALPDIRIVEAPVAADQALPLSTDQKLPLSTEQRAPMHAPGVGLEEAASASKPVAAEAAAPQTPATVGKAPSSVAGSSDAGATFKAVMSEAVVAPGEDDGAEHPLALQASAVSRDLVVLRTTNGRTPAAYQQALAQVLEKRWRRTSLFFSSASEGDGSNEAAVNLAALVSRQQLPVLLVELQVTEPVVWGLLGRPPLRCGFEEALRGKSEFAACAQPIAGESLNVLLVREAMTVAEAGQLSGALNDFLEWAEERYAWLIFTCPPVLTPGWTRWLDLNADPVVLVARRNKTRQHELRKAARHLGDRLAGTLLSAPESAARRAY